MSMELIVKQYTDNVNADPQLKAYRDWIEANAFGFGERCFLWMWKELIDQMPDNFTFLEIGVFRGQILAAVEMLAFRAGKKAVRYGVTPLDSSDGHWESDYKADIKHLHDIFAIKNDYRIIPYDSTSKEAIEAVSDLKGKVDLVYIDGGHTYEVVKQDLQNYIPLVKPGGFLVIDDCNNKVEMPFGYFRGIESVSKAVDELLPPFTDHPDFEFVQNVVHNRILKRKG